MPFFNSLLERLAGRVESLAILYRTLAAEDHKGELDLGVYLSQIAAVRMSAPIPLRGFAST